MMEFIRVQTDLFSPDGKIGQILAEKNGERLALLWIKLLCLAGKDDAMGAFSLNGNPRTINQLSVATGTPKSLMEQGIKAFLDLGMLVQENGFYVVKNWGKYQKMDTDEERKASDRERQAKYRERRKRNVTCHTDVTLRGVTDNVTDNVTHNAEVTPCHNAEKDKDIDIDIPPLNPPPRRNAADGEACADLSEGGYIPSGFAAFWDAYPKKENFLKARKAWISLAPDEKMASAILSGVKRDAKTDSWLRENGRYIPMPERYLAERRWEDKHPSQERGEKSYGDVNDVFEKITNRKMEVMA